MKKIFKPILAVAIASPMLLTGCIDETFPTNGVSQDQLTSSAKAGEALLWAMPAELNAYDVFGNGGSYAYDWGYGSIMHIRDVMTEDMAIVYSTYDWYTSWEYNQYNDERYASTQFIWNYMWKLVLTTNNTVGAFEEIYQSGEAEDYEKGYLGIGYAFRAAVYLDLARMYEFLPNDAISGVNNSGNDVTNLTVPIVTNNTTEEEAKNNPRASRQEMYNFILSDLDNAEELIGNVSRMAKTLPDISVVYGLKARLYMWVEDYANARSYARKAIDTGGYTPMTQDEWLNTTTGFNDLSSQSWMWGGQYVKEDDAVQTGILNWTSWSSNETVFGYNSVGPMTMAGASFYDRISDNDFRKLSWVAPEGSKLRGQESFVDEMFNPSSGSTYALPEYASLKFRPNEGNYTEYTTACVVGYPLMRVEEMYFIEAEAAAHSNPGEGKTLLENFMQTYRYSRYSCDASDQEGVIDEIFLQKRIELWGEGQSYYDYKRLDKSVTRKYDGTNFAADAQFNTNGRPAWMNFVIVQTEENNNAAVMGWNNPSSADCYK